MSETNIPESTSFSWRNFWKDTPANVLFIALLIEGAIAIALSADWVDEKTSLFWARALPLIQFAVGQFKLFFNKRLAEMSHGKTFTVTTSDPDATMEEKPIYPHDPGH